MAVGWLVIVFRVEDEYGRGPYFGEGRRYDGAFYSRCMELVHLGIDNTDRHPYPENDGLPYPQEWEKCGFESVSQLLDWFSGFEDVLHKDGYFPVRIDVPDNMVVVGWHQLLFTDTTTCIREVLSWEQVIDPSRKVWWAETVGTYNPNEGEQK